MASKNTKKQQVQANKNAVAVGKAASVNIGSSLSAISATSVKIQGDLAKIGEELIQKHAELQAVDETIRIRKEEMANLHGADQVLLSIDEAKALHTQYLEEQQKQKEQIEQEHQDLQNQRVQERDREEAEYTYKLQQTRKADNDAWAEQVRLRGNQERDRREAFEKDIASRELVLKTRETEFQAAISKAATFEQEVDSRVKREVAIVTNSMKKDFEHEKQLASIQHTALYDKQTHDNKRLVEALNNLEAQLKEAQTQLKDAYAKNVELASKAVDGAANAKAQADAITTLSNLSATNGQRART